MKARARRTDPATSHMAARKAEKSGKCCLYRFVLLNFVRKYHGKTAGEIHEATGIDRHEVSRRLPELRAAGLVTNPGKRVCRVLGNMSMTWSVK